MIHGVVRKHINSSNPLSDELCGGVLSPPTNLFVILKFENVYLYNLNVY